MEDHPHDAQAIPGRATRRACLETGHTCAGTVAGSAGITRAGAGYNVAVKLNMASLISKDPVKQLKEKSMNKIAKTHRLAYLAAGIALIGGLGCGGYNVHPDRNAMQQSQTVKPQVTHVATS